MAGVTRWTQEQDDILLEMRNAGESSRAIGLVLKCSRNAVIGRAKRLGTPRMDRKTANGIPRPPRERKPSIRRTPAGFTTSASREQAMATPAPEPSAPTSPPVALLDLKPHQCRFPIWDHQARGAPMPDPMLFCGAPAVGSFCGHHARLCYTDSGVTWLQRNTRQAQFFS